MAAYSSDGFLQFGAVIDRFRARASPPKRDIICRIWPDDAFIAIELKGLSRTLQVRFDDIHKLLAHPSRSWLVLAVERFPRMFVAGDKRFRKPIMPDANVWSLERNLILHLETAGWFEHLSPLLPVLQLDARATAEQGMSPLRLPASFEKLYLMEVIRHASVFRLTQEGVDMLAEMHIDNLLVEAAALVNTCETDVLTDLVPLHEIIGTTARPQVALTSPTPYHYLVRHCVVNPFDVIPKFPYLVQSSRLLDMCAELGVVEYLIVVAFTEVSGERISNQVSKKVDDVFQSGLLVAGRCYSFLAASSDQLRHGSSWFLCEDNPNGITVKLLRSKIGNLSMITNQVKFLSRLGLALSTSRQVCDLKDAIVVVEDVIHNGQNFTDGCGEMSTELAECIAEELALGFVPAAVQIRLGGCKGVLVRNAALKGKVAKIRMSLIKFESSDTVLRVVSVAQAGPLSLNHDILTLLGPHVPYSTWQRLLHEELLSLATPLYASSTADLPKHLLERFLSALSPVISRTSFTHMSLNIWNDPLCLNIMRGVYLGCIMDLCERMHIPVKAGVMLMGVADPTGTLAPNEVAFMWNEACYEGSVIVYRNPLSHPGDVRKLVAVNRPEFADLEGVLIFSVQPEEAGALPQFAKCSGGDLDGDHYAVLLDIEPTEQVHSGDDRQGSDILSKPLDMQSVEIDKYVEYGASRADSSEAEAFLQIALNNVLGQVSNAHKAMADQSDSGAYDERCFKLAAMACIAVDSPKTGDIVKVPEEFRSDQYPDWMLNNSKPAYTSKKVLGKLFRTVKDLQYVSVLHHDSSLDQYHDTAYMPVGTDSDTALTDRISDIFNQYLSKMDVALAGWGLRNEVEMLVGPLKKKLTRFDFHRYRKRVTKTQAVLEQLCEEFADVFDEVLSQSSKPLAIVVALWWSADAKGLSAFRWVPWRRHSMAIGEVITIQNLHQLVSAPLARLGASMLDEKFTGRDVNAAAIVRKVVERFLIAALQELFSLYLDGPGGAVETAQVCLNVLCEDFEFVAKVCQQQDIDSAVFDGLLFKQECGRALVAAVVQLPHLARSRSEAIGSTLQSRLGYNTSMVNAQLQRLLQCHAHRLSIWLDKRSLEEPMQLHQQLYSLSLKQQQMLAVTQVFVRELRIRTGAQIRMQNIEKGFGKQPVRSLLVSGTLAQLFKVEHELHFLESTPTARTLKFDDVAASFRFRDAVSGDSLVTLSDIVHSINPIHQRRRQIASEIAIIDAPLVGGNFFGGPPLSELLKHKLAEPFEMLEILVKIGSFYILGAPNQLLGPAPDRKLTARELVALLIGNRHQQVDVEIAPGGRGRKGRGKGGRPFVIHYLRSGFNATFSSAPAMFSPTLTSVSLKFKEKASPIGLSLVFHGRCAEVLGLRKDERRTMMYTECLLAPEGMSWRGDLRVVANANTLVGESEELYVRIMSKPPVSLPSDGVPVCDTSGEWYRNLKLNTDDYEFEIIRIHSVMARPRQTEESCQFEIDHVVSLVPEGSGVAIESDLFEVAMRLDPMLGAEVEVEMLDNLVGRAIEGLRQEISDNNI